MDTHKVLEKITLPGDAPPSIGRDIFASHVARKELSFEDYLDSNAILFADSVQNYLPAAYRPMAQSIETYVNRRLQLSTGYDPATASHLSQWLIDAFRAREENKLNIGSMRWAKQRCLNHKLMNQVAKLDRAIMEIEHMKFPQEQFQRALAVKQLDCVARERGI